MLAYPAFAGDQTDFHKSVEPLLNNYCYDCHGDGASKGHVAFDQIKGDPASPENRDLWFKALKNLRAGLMPPARKARPTAEEQAQIAHWIKSVAFHIDPENPDPGRVTLRRLNRTEYHNTIRDLLGVDFDTRGAFPPDDTGYGFDTIGDVLNLPPMLLEKYMDAAEKIVAQAVPVTPKVVRKKIIDGSRFQGRAGGEAVTGNALSFHANASVSNTITVKWPGQYQVGINLQVNERFVDNVFDYNKCRVLFLVDGKELWRRDFNREADRKFHFDFYQEWLAGEHSFVFRLQPLTPDEPLVRDLSMEIGSVAITGPMSPEHWVTPENYAKFFPKPVPTGASARRQYAGELLAQFARRAFRRPVDERTVNRLAALAEDFYSRPGKTFEAGVAHGMIAVLSSPRFLYREEKVDPNGKGPYALVDEYSLASRLSYFLWSSMPDDELFKLAGEGHLREQLPAQLTRMLKDWRSEAFVRDFTGQWLRARDIETVDIEPISVMARERKPDPERLRLRERYHELKDRPQDTLTKAEKEELAAVYAELQRRFSKLPKASFDGEIRYDMRRETESVFDYVLRENRSLLELLDSDYTFLNQRLAAHYGISNVYGSDMRLVKLPPDSPRGGVLTEGTVLAVTSNPTRTSPVKRGLFILDNILGTPPPPPPPNIPPLEDAAKNAANPNPSLRETLAMHRAKPLCASCHARMDPLGLALENFNAMGMWRDSELSGPIDATGTLTTGESFTNIRELKHILATNHAADFYRTLTEKLLTYALGRGLEYYDVETVDRIVAGLEASNGRPSVLIEGVVNSAPFQKTRTRSSTSVAANGKSHE